MHYTTPDLRLKVYDKSDYVDGVIASDPISVNDVLVAPNIFGEEYYTKVIEEIEKVDKHNRLFKLWHKDSHFIADDKFQGGKWKDQCVVFNEIIESMATAFNVIPEATRINWYRGGDRGQWGQSEYKPYHYDRAAKVPLPQNITIALSFGATREIGFRHSRRKAHPRARFKNIKGGQTTHIVCKSGTIYAFSRDVNVEFQHAVVPAHRDYSTADTDRVSIIIWGVRDDMDVGESRISKSKIPSMEELEARYYNNSKRK
jgi:hypothetical protein